MVGVVYDSLVFKTESEVGRSLQEYIEEGEIHIVALGSSSHTDQAALIPERLAELEGLTVEITSSSGIQIVDTLRFFKGDRPAAEFEAGVSCGGNYPCVGCTCHRDRFSDFPHAANCEQRSLEGIQEVALAGHFGRVPGKLKFYEELSTQQLRMELEKRAVMDYPTDKVGRLAKLKQTLCGVQRVPALLLFAPESTLADHCLSSYCVLLCEPLHDLKGYLAGVLRKLPSVLPPSALKLAVSECLDLLWKKTNLYGSDLREALIEVAHIFVSNASQGPAFEFITYLVQLSKILYSKDSSRSPKQCLQLYNCTFMIHQLHCELFGEALTSSYFHALLTHCPVQHEFVCSRSANAESEERIFKGAEAAAKCTDRKPENMLPAVLKRLQCQRKSKTKNPLLSLQKANSRIAQSAEKLPPFKGTTCTAEFVKNRRYAYQAHLQRIGHFLVLGEGVWWHRSTDGCILFHDAFDDPEFSDAGPVLLHFRDTKMEDVLKRSSACWQDALKRKVSLPLDDIRCYDSVGNMTALVNTQYLNVSNDPFPQPASPPPLISTPLGHQSVPQAAPLQPAGQDDVRPEKEHAQEEVSQTMDTEGFIDMSVEVVSHNPHTSLQSNVSKAVASLVGETEELHEFDHCTALCKHLGKMVAPAILQKHKSLARHFRKLLSVHKRNLEYKLTLLPPSDVEHKKCT